MPCSTEDQKDNQDQESLGRSQDDLTTKVLIEALGTSLKFLSTLRQRAHSTQANRFIRPDTYHPSFFLVLFSSL